MCFGRSQATPAPQRTFDDSPPVVTGSQTGVKNPIDTKKVTEKLEQDRRESEGFFNPGDSLKIPGVTRRSGSNSLASKQAKTNRQNTAKRNFNKKKYSKGITGRKTGVA